jgi:F-type H+-transporting ATPase subunit b
MLLDWFTIIAQLVNFLVLVWLLKRFLYKPILKTIDEREKHIVMQLQDAENKKAEAIKELEDIRRKNNELEQQRQILMDKTISEVNVEHQRLLEASRKEIEDLRLRLHQALQTEQQNLSSEIMQRTRSEVFTIVRKILKDIASSSLEEQIGRVFIHRIQELTADEKNKFYLALKTDLNQVFIRSAFNLPTSLQTAIEATVKKSFNIEPQFKFETAEHMVSGIELTAGGYKITWSIEEYLISIETGISELLKDKKHALA